jgi:hypothetical protein
VNAKANLAGPQITGIAGFKTVAVTTTLQVPTISTPTTKGQHVADLVTSDDIFSTGNLSITRFYSIKTINCNESCYKYDHRDVS